MSFTVGENVGPYRIVEQLGQGGMATVYKAFHAALDRYVALKALHPAFGQDPNFEARFQREARLVAKLEHAHIVPVYDYAEHEGRPYLVMKFIEGDTLKARLAKWPLNSAEIANVVESVGSALAYAHRQGILHRDIKPSNVLIGNDGHMWLADFGLARIAQSPESTLSSDMIMGTPQYISPEQAMGEKKLDEGTDIYSFGVMLYEMVVGQVPFNADTPFSIIHDHIYSPLPMPRAINPKVPEPVERVLLKALAKERSARYADIGALVQAFKDAWVESGVPMQGTAITMRPGALKAAAKTAAPVPISPPVAPAVSTAVSKKAHARNNMSLVFIGGGAVLLVCIAVAAFAAFRSSGFFGLQFFGLPPHENTAFPTEAVTNVVPVQVDATGIPETPTETTSPPVATAQAAADQNPRDPQTQLNLSLALWDVGLVRPSMLALVKAADLANRDTAFFDKAAAAFRQRQAWIPAAAMYVRAVKTTAPGQPSTELVNSMHEALYKAAVQPDLPQYLSFPDLALVEQPMGMVTQSRHLYYNGNTEKAHELLNQVGTLKPHMPEAALLAAEMNANEGKTFEAKQTLNILIGALDTPDWIREAAQQLSNKIP